MSTARRTARFIWALVAAVAVAIVFLWPGIRVAQSRGCGSCHEMKPFVDAWTDSSHRYVSCAACHAPADSYYWANRYLETLRALVPLSSGDATVSATGAGVSDRACLSCHSAVTKGVTDSRGLRIRHSSCAAEARCDDCHGVTAHASATRWIRQPVMEDCIACHREKSGPTACDSCHVGRSQRERLAMGPWQVTHGATWSKTHGMGSLSSCAECHDPSYCARCHGIPLPHSDAFPRTHGDDAVRPGSKCFQCHDKQDFCTECHGLEMPHPASFLPTHSKVAGTSENEKCLKCHTAGSCDACHNAHVHPGGALPPPVQPWEKR